MGVNAKLVEKRKQNKKREMTEQFVVQPTEKHKGKYDSRKSVDVDCEKRN